jgi:hypothetical protein
MHRKVKGKLDRIDQKAGLHQCSVWHFMLEYFSLQTCLTSAKKEQKGEETEDPGDLSFSIASQLMFQEPCLENTGRVQESRGR